MKEQILKIEKEFPKEKCVITHDAMLQLFFTKFQYRWHYNEIVGYLNLYILGTQFRGDLWFINKKRINKGIVKKKFVYRDKAFESTIPQQATSSQIFDLMLESISCFHTTKYKKFHFDLKTFRVIGQFVDWKQLTRQLDSYTYPEHKRNYFENE